MQLIRTSKTLPEESNNHLSIQTLTRHVITCSSMHMCSSACVYVQLPKWACKDIWLKKHAKPLGTSEVSLMFEVKSVKCSLSFHFNSITLPQKCQRRHSVCVDSLCIMGECSLSRFLCQVEENSMINNEKHANWLPLVCKNMIALHTF